MHVLLKHRPGAATRILESAKILSALLLSPPLAVILAGSPNRRPDQNVPGGGQADGDGRLALQ